jgi:hypothetical protein
MLAERSEVFPMGLLLMADGRLEVYVAAYESVKQIPDLLNAMQSSLKEKAAAGGAVASCIAYPDYGAEEIVAFLENSENYCATAKLPVAGSPFAVDLSGITVLDGYINVFPLNG